MKKLTVFLCCVILAVSLCACKKDVGTEPDNLIAESDPSTGAIEHDVTEDTVAEDSVAEDPVDKVQVDESLYEKLIREIDGAYIEEQKTPKGSTTIGMVEISDKYTEKWKQVADEYYDKIMKFDGITKLNENYYSSEDLHTFVSNMKTNWEEYNQEQCTNYLKTLQTIYGAGTIVGPIFANYKYEMQKEWALQLVGICQQLHIE